jgi:transposase-like protein
MVLLPRVRKCPRCEGFNVFRVNGVTYENAFKSLADWTVKKKFNCRKCKIELGLFEHSDIEKKEKLVWIDLFKCEDYYFDRLKELQIDETKNTKQSEKYYKVQREITNIRNKIALDQIKVKIKAKIQKKGMLI